jgi:hypothetical protein
VLAQLAKRTNILIFVSCCDLPGSFHLFSGSTVALRFIQPPYSAAISAAVQPSIFFVLLEKFTPTPTTGLPSAQAAR